MPERSRPVPERSQTPLNWGRHARALVPPRAPSDGLRRAGGGAAYRTDDVTRDHASTSTHRRPPRPRTRPTARSRSRTWSESPSGNRSGNAPSPRSSHTRSPGPTWTTVPSTVAVTARPRRRSVSSRPAPHVVDGDGLGRERRDGAAVGQLPQQHQADGDRGQSPPDDPPRPLRHDVAASASARTSPRLVPCHTSASTPNTQYSTTPAAWTRMAYVAAGVAATANRSVSAWTVA